MTVLDLPYLRLDSVPDLPPISVPLQFHEGEPIVITDRDVIDACPLIGRAVSNYNPYWEDSETILAEPLRIPFRLESGRLLFEHMLTYPAPDIQHGETTLEMYPAAAAKTPAELKDLIELANFLECERVVQSTGFVIAQKIQDWDVEEIAAYMNLVVTGPGDDYDPDREWMHPQAASLHRNVVDHRDRV